MEWFNLIGYLASVLMFSTFYMKKMIPLRAVGASANVTFVIYAAVFQIYPLLILHAMLFPLNVTRMIQMMRLVKKVEEAAKGGFTFEFLVPFMTKVNYKKGDVVCRRGDASDKLFYLQKGLIKVEGVGTYVTDGELVGEIGIFSHSNKRTDTLVCESDSTVYTMPEKQILQLYYQNPKFGFYLVQLIIKRFSKNINTAKQMESLMKGEDRRQAERLDLKFTVVASGAGRSGEGFIETASMENISSEGALLKLQQEVTAGSELEIVIDPSNSSLKVLSKVVWAEYDGEVCRCGITFNKKSIPSLI